MSNFKVGRLDSLENLIHDAPNKTVEAILTKQDEIIAALKALDAANTGVPEVTALEELELHL